MANKTKFTLPVWRNNNVLQICNLPERKKKTYKCLLKIRFLIE